MSFFNNIKSIFHEYKDRSIFGKDNLKSVLDKEKIKSVFNEDELKKWKFIFIIAISFFIFSVISIMYKDYSTRSLKKETTEYYKAHTQEMLERGELAVKNFYNTLIQGKFEEAFELVSTVRKQEQIISLRVCDESYECSLSFKHSFIETFKEGVSLDDGEISIKVKRYYPDLLLLRELAYKELEKEGRAKGMTLWERDGFIRKNTENKVRYLLENTDYPLLEKEFVTNVYKEIDGYKVKF